MKHILKQSEPNGLGYAREHNLNWDEFHKHFPLEYIECRKQAYEEQKGECAYTGMPLNENATTHLDHFKKKSIYSTLTFVWNNLFAAIKDSHYGADYKDNFINGINAGEVYNILLNPALDDPESYFWYSNDGKIEPRNDLSTTEKLRAETTIRVFNLNNSTLLHRRRELFSMLSDYRELNFQEVSSALKNYGFSFIISAYYQER